MRYPDVTEAAVYAIPDESVGDRVMAALVTPEGTDFDPVEFRDFLAAQADLGPKQWPAFVRVASAPPRTDLQDHQAAAVGGGALTATIRCSRYRADASGQPARVGNTRAALPCRVVRPGLVGEPEFVQAVERVGVTDHRIVGAEQHLREPVPVFMKFTRSAGGVGWYMPRCRCRRSRVCGDGHHLLRPRVADVAAHDHEFGEVQRDLVDVGESAFLPVSPRAAAARCDRPGCRTEPRVRRTRRTVDSSAGRWAAGPRARAPPAGRRSRRRAPAASSPHRCHRPVEVDGGQTGEPGRGVAAPIRRPRRWTPDSGRWVRARR